MPAERVEKERLTDVPVTATGPVVPAACLDALLRASCRCATTNDAERMATMLFEAVEPFLTNVAIGACIPLKERQIVVRRSPRLCEADQESPTRLFINYGHERVIPIADDASATLHVAFDAKPFDEGSFDGTASDSRGFDARALHAEPLSDPDGAELDRTTQAILDRVAEILGANLARTRNEENLALRAEEADRLRAQIIQSEKLASLGQIAAGIVHELNNPLTSIVAYSDYLKRKWEREARDISERDRLARINEAAERILAFSRDLIAYARPAAEVPSALAVHDVVERALGFCEHVIHSTQVVVEKRLAPSIGLVLGVGGQLTQVFVNLFTNACHAMLEEGGRLTVITELEGAEVGGKARCVRITVSDDGHGIEEENLERIFDPFFTTKTDGTGTGLGLSIVRNIMTAHAGSIYAERNEPRGTRFVLKLPLAADG